MRLLQTHHAQLLSYLFCFAAIFSIQYTSSSSIQGKTESLRHLTNRAQATRSAHHLLRHTKHLGWAFSALAIAFWVLHGLWNAPATDQAGSKSNAMDRVHQAIKRVIGSLFFGGLPHLSLLDALGLMVAIETLVALLGKEKTSPFPWRHGFFALALALIGICALWLEKHPLVYIKLVTDQTNWLPKTTISPPFLAEISSEKTTLSFPFFVHLTLSFAGCVKALKAFLLINCLVAVFSFGLIVLKDFFNFGPAPTHK